MTQKYVIINNMIMFFCLRTYVGFPDGSVVKKSTCKCRGHGFNPWVRKIPRE